MKKFLIGLSIVLNLVLGTISGIYAYNTFIVKPKQPEFHDTVYCVSIENNSIEYGEYISINVDDGVVTQWIDTDPEWSFFGDSDWVACSYITFDYQDAVNHLG